MNSFLSAALFEEVHLKCLIQALQFSCVGIFYYIYFASNPYLLRNIVYVTDILGSVIKNLYSVVFGWIADRTILQWNYNSKLWCRILNQCSLLRLFDVVLSSVPNIYVCFPLIYILTKEKYTTSWECFQI